MDGRRKLLALLVTMGVTAAGVSVAVFAQGGDSPECGTFAARVETELRAQKTDSDRTETFLDLAKAQPRECDVFQPRLLPID